jgi:phosphoglycerate dehydrogenase-like enzyme
MAKPRCAILDDYQDAARSSADWSVIEGDVSVERFGEAIVGREALAQKLAPFDIVIAMRERTVFDAELFPMLPRLKLPVGPAAELTWGLLLALMRNIPAENANFHAGGSQWQLSVGRDLKAKTLGVVGLGKLGQKVIGYGKAFDMDVVGWSKNATPERCAALGIRHAASLHELLAQSDVVTLHLTLNEETRGIISATELAAMKRDAVLINTSRGPLVDEAALVDALAGGTIGGAGLDTFDSEPLPADHPLRGLPNVIATPHLGYVTQETYRIYYSGAVEAIRAWLDGTPAHVLHG